MEIALFVTGGARRGFVSLRGKEGGRDRCQTEMKGGGKTDPSYFSAIQLLLLPRYAQTEFVIVLLYLHHGR